MLNYNVYVHVCVCMQPCACMHLYIWKYMFIISTIISANIYHPEAFRFTLCELILLKN